MQPVTTARERHGNGGFVRVKRFYSLKLPAIRNRNWNRNRSESAIWPELENKSEKNSGKKSEKKSEKKSGKNRRFRF